jgi:hypothetical protein
VERNGAMQFNGSEGIDGYNAGWRAAGGPDMVVECLIDAAGGTATLFRPPPVRMGVCRTAAGAAPAQDGA